MTVQTFSRGGGGSGGGIGDATCPSLEQLQGVVDPNDPCQGLSVPGGGTVNPLTFAQPIAQPAPAMASACPAGSTCSIITGVPNTAVYTLGAILGVFMLMGVVTK